MQTTLFQEPTQPKETKTPPPPIEIVGNNWVEDEIFVRRRRECMQAIPSRRNDPGILGQALSGPCLQLRPYLPDVGSAVIRISMGRKLDTMLRLSAKGKYFDRDLVRVVVGSVVSCGDCKRVRIECALDLTAIGMDPSVLFGMKLGLWERGLFTHDGRYYFRCVFWCNWPGLSTGQYNEPVDSHLTGRTLLVRAASAPDFSYPWLTVEVQQGAPEEGPARIGVAIRRKALRSWAAYAMHFGLASWAPPHMRYHNLMDDLIKLASRPQDTVAMLSLYREFTHVHPAAIACHIPRRFEEDLDWGKRKASAERKRYYLPTLVQLYELDAIMADTAGFIDWNSTLPAAPTEAPSQADAQRNYEAEAEDIE